MVLDPIRPTETPAVTHVAGARATSVSPRPGKPYTPIDPRPVAAAAAEPHDEVNVKWDHSDGVIVTFTDKKSGDIVRQIPSEQVLSVARFIRQMLEEEGVTTGSEDSN